MQNIKTYIVSGFLDAGKTTYIQDFITRDFFHKKENGKTLVLTFECGETEFDLSLTKDYRTVIAIWEKENIKSFIYENIKKHKPDRIFAEVNAMTPGLFDIIERELAVVSNTMLINAESLELYYRNMTEILSGMIKKADPVIFNRADAKEELDAYSTPFRLLNPKATFLWESPLGYHEKVFGNVLTFDKDAEIIVLKDSDYPLWVLDITQYPESYNGKLIQADLQIRSESSEAGEMLKAGRIVMTCCMNDLQFIGFELLAKEKKEQIKGDGFYNIVAGIDLAEDAYYKRKMPVLKLKEIKSIQPPRDAFISVRACYN